VWWHKVNLGGGLCCIIFISLIAVTNSSHKGFNAVSVGTLHVAGLGLSTFLAANLSSKLRLVSGFQTLPQNFGDNLCFDVLVQTL